MPFMTVDIAVQIEVRNIVYLDYVNMFNDKYVMLANTDIPFQEDDGTMGIMHWNDDPEIPIYDRTDHDKVYYDRLDKQIKFENYTVESYIERLMQADGYSHEDLEQLKKINVYPYDYLKDFKPVLRRGIMMFVNGELKSVYDHENLSPFFYPE